MGGFAVETKVQPSKDLTSLSASASKRGHHTLVRKRAFIETMSERPLCAALSTNSPRTVGIIRDPLSKISQWK